MGIVAVSPKRSRATEHRAASARIGPVKWWHSSKTSKSKEFPNSAAWMQALAYVVTVTDRISRWESPRIPASIPSPRRIRRCHWYIKSRTGATIKARWDRCELAARRFERIDSATSVFPVPVGMTMIPCRDLSHPAIAWICSGRREGSLFALFSRSMSGAVMISGAVNVSVCELVLVDATVLVGETVSIRKVPTVSTWSSQGNNRSSIVLRTWSYLYASVLHRETRGSHTQIPLPKISSNPFAWLPIGPPLISSSNVPASKVNWFGARDICGISVRIDGVRKSLRVEFHRKGLPFDRPA